MKARELLNGLQYSVICGDEDVEIKEIYNDSRKVGEQGLFFCIVGANFDGHAYVKDVIEKGAVCLVVQKDVEPVPGVLIVKVDSTRYGNCQQQLLRKSFIQADRDRNYRNKR